MSKKYELTEETMTYGKVILHRIKALKDFGYIKKGELGGWIESEDNLSQEGLCWVHGKAKVFGNAKVSKNAQVHRDAKVFGSARIYGNATVSDSAIVRGNATVHGNAHVHGSARIYEWVDVGDNANIRGESHVLGHTTLRGNVCLSGNSRINTKSILCCTSDVLTVGPISKNEHWLTFFNGGSEIEVSCDFFSGSIEDFTTKIKLQSPQSVHDDLLKAIDYAKAVLSGESYSVSGSDKKYMLTNNSINYNARTLYRIKALKDFGDVKKGDLGGWVGSEENLSQDGNCWIWGNAIVYGNAKVSKNAQVYRDTKVYGGATVTDDCQIFDNATVHGNAHIRDMVKIFGKADIFDDAMVQGHATVCENARVFGFANIDEAATVQGYAEIYGTARISGTVIITGVTRIGSNSVVKLYRDFLMFGPVNSLGDYITFSKSPTGINVVYKNFNEPFETFKNNILKTCHNIVSWENIFSIAEHFSKNEFF